MSASKMAEYPMYKIINQCRLRYIHQIISTIIDIHNIQHAKRSKEWFFTNFKGLKALCWPHQKKIVDSPFLFSSGLGDSQLHKGLTNTTKRHGTDVLRIIQNRLSQRDPTKN